MDDKMTVFYRKSTADLTDVIQGEQTMSLYGDLEADYTLIYNFIVVDYDEYIMKNPILFTVTDGVIRLKNSTTMQKYI